MKTALLISIDLVRDMLNISQSRIADKPLKFTILRVQEVKLAAVLPPGLYNKIVTDKNDGRLTGKYQLLVEEFITKYLIEELGTLPHLFPKEDRDAIVEMHSQYINFYKNRLIEHINDYI